MKVCSTCKAAILTYISVICLANPVHSQSSIYSEETIKFDVLTQKPDKPIPFDRSFTLEVSKVPVKDVLQVDLYEAQVQNGQRSLVQNQVTCRTNTFLASVKDATLYFDNSGESLLIFFPPLKPNQLFDVNVITKLSVESRTLLREVDTLLVRRANANAKYQQFILSTIGKNFNRTYTDWLTVVQYQPFFNTSLLPLYGQILRPANYQISTLTLTEVEIQAIGIASDSVVDEFKDGKYFQALINRPTLPPWSIGLIDIRNVYAREPQIKPLDLLKRQLALKSNISLLDSLLRRLDLIRTHGIDAISINRRTVTFATIRANVATALSQTILNSEFIGNTIKRLDTRVDSIGHLAQGIYLAGNTLASDLKTQGGNVLFVDAGLTNMIVPGVTSSAVNIPKLYYGVSIYFRPIDKNTRRNKFPKDFTQYSPPLNRRCIINGTDTVYGPDYAVLARKTILQQLSLNVGLTVGGMTNKDFDNFLTSNSLLIGPAIRFKRAFKASAGISLVRRNSRDPLISEKVTVMGSYISLSVDIDFIQSIKDITSMVLK
ncbi:hypothetical protein [Chryseolinea soli]|uniref:DUF4403 family protein n=1 Tax=Chryseolinea soli TaxID=2321403 RepID=A0A385SR38_9BACT|nr:hypothetical protein [Chryseolinea soli]AYB32020.1 hypothetical protein D4L85_16240 [Chryseolinea soli]